MLNAMLEEGVNMENTKSDLLKKQNQTLDSFFQSEEGKKAWITVKGETRFRSHHVNRPCPWCEKFKDCEFIFCPNCGSSLK